VTDPVRTLEQEKLADRFDRYARHAVLGAIPIALIAVFDLATGSLTGDSRIDIALLGAAAMSFWSAFSLSRLGRRFRRGALPQRTGWMFWARSVAPIAASLGFSAGLGYLIGGWTLAVVLPSVTTALMGVAVGLGLRRRRTHAEQGRTQP
jgi:hypothetical protein